MRSDACPEQFCHDDDVTTVGADRRRQQGLIVWLIESTGPEADAVDALARAAAVNMDPEERAAQYRRIQELVLAENGGPLITLYQMHETMGLAANLDFRRGPDGWHWFGSARWE